MTEMNGKTEDPRAAVAAVNQVQAPNPQMVLDAQVRQLLGILLRGLLVSAPGVQPHDLLNSVSRQTGSLVAGSLQGDLATMLRVRKGFKDAFAEGVQGVPIQQPGQAPEPPPR